MCGVILMSLDVLLHHINLVKDYLFISSFRLVLRHYGIKSRSCCEKKVVIIK